VATVRTLAFLDEGRRLVTCDAFGKEKHWNLAAQDPSVIPSGIHRSSHQFIACVPALKLVATPNRGRDGVHIWSTDSGTVTSLSEGELSDVRGVAISQDGKLAAAATSGGTYIWNVEKREVIRKLDTANADVVVAFHPDGSYLAAGGESGLVLWEVHGNRRIRLAGYESSTVFRSLTFSRRKHLSDRTLLAGGGGNMKFRSKNEHGEAIVWDITDLTKITESNKREFKHTVYSVDFSPSAESLAIGALEPELKVLDLTTDELRETKKHSWWVTCVTYTPDGSRLVTANQGGQITFWDAKTLANLGSFNPHEHVRRIALTENSLVTASSEGLVKSWRVAGIAMCRAKIAELSATHSDP
jgi:WD40 repeat protein